LNYLILTYPEGRFINDPHGGILNYDALANFLITLGPVIEGVFTHFRAYHDNLTVDQLARLDAIELLVNRRAETRAQPWGRAETVHGYELAAQDAPSLTSGVEVHIASDSEKATQPTRNELLESLGQEDGVNVDPPGRPISSDPVVKAHALDEMRLMYGSGESVRAETRVGEVENKLREAGFIGLVKDVDVANAVVDVQAKLDRPALIAVLPADKDILATLSSDNDNVLKGILNPANKQELLELNHLRIRFVVITEVTDQTEDIMSTAFEQQLFIALAPSAADHFKTIVPKVNAVVANVRALENLRKALMK